MSTLRINNIEAQSVPASPTIDEKVKVTNSSGDILVNIDGKTSGITTIGINTTDGNIKFDANSNVLITGILTATNLSADTFTPNSLEIGSNIKLGNAGVITATNFKSGVTNVHNLGVTLSGGQLDVGSNIKLGTAGVVTATSFVGSGANLTGLTIPGGATNLDLLDSSGTGNGRIRLGASQDLQIYHDGSHSWFKNTTGRLLLQTDGDQIQLRGNTIVAFNGAASTEYLRIDSSGRLLVGSAAVTYNQSPLYVSGTDPVVATFHHSDGGTNDQARIALGALVNNPPYNRGVYLTSKNNGNGHDFIVATSASHAAGPSEKLRITNAGAFGLAGANYGSSGQVLTSQGSSSAPVWANAGITMADQWRVTSSSTLPGSVSILNSNWARVASPSGYGNLGSAMSESSGAFTFPATGIYFIEFTILISMTQSARYVGNRIQTTTDNFSSANTVAETLGHMALTNSFGAYHTSTSSLIFDVTNTSTHKIRFCGVSINPSASSVIGNTNQNSTFVTFIRLGDT